MVEADCIRNGLENDAPFLLVIYKLQHDGAGIFGLFTAECDTSKLEQRRCSLVNSVCRNTFSRVILHNSQDIAKQNVALVALFYVHMRRCLHVDGTHNASLLGIIFDDTKAQFIIPRREMFRQRQRKRYTRCGKHLKVYTLFGGESGSRQPIAADKFEAHYTIKRQCIEFAQYDMGRILRTRIKGLVKRWGCHELESWGS